MKRKRILQLTALLTCFGTLSTLLSFGSGLSAASTAKKDPYGKYTPEITVTMVHQTGDATVKFQNGDSFENNVFTRAYESTLGIKVKYLWVATGDDEAQKTQVMLASGQLPDIFMCDNMSQYESLVKGGKLQDLTSAYNNYATDYTKYIYSGDYSRELTAVKESGKLYTIPWFNDYNAIISMVWIRADWLKKLKLPVPKTGAELIKTAQAFKSKDPDGDGKADTYGIAMDQDGIDSSFWNMFHSYPGIFTLDSATKKLVYGMYGSKTQAAATRKGLRELQTLYKQGVIRKDFATMDDDNQAEDIVSGKCGIFFGTASRPYFELQNSTKQNKNADWVCIGAPSMDSGKPTISADPLNQYGLYVVKKGFSHPEALIKLLNFYNKVQNDPKTMTQKDMDTYSSYFKAAPVRLYDPHTTFSYASAITQAIKKKNAGKLDSSQKQIYDSIELYLKTGDKTAANTKNKTGWSHYKYYGPGGGISVAQSYVSKKEYVYNLFTGAPTKSMTVKQPIIDKQWKQVMMDVITGSPLSEFDSFVNQYPALGGTGISKEVNAWYQAKSGRK